MTDNLPATVEFSDTVVRQIAMDVGKQVVDHIEHAYSDMCDVVAWKSARLSIRNCTHNAIMEAVKAANEGAIEPMLLRHDSHRREMRRLRKAAGKPCSTEDMARLSASEYACYRWPEDTAEHRAMRAAFMDGAAHVAVQS